MNSESAKRLLANHDFIEVMKHVEDAIITGMKTSAMMDLDTHHELVLSLQLVENLKRVLENAAQGDMVDSYNTKMLRSVT